MENSTNPFDAAATSEDPVIADELTELAADLAASEEADEFGDPFAEETHHPVQELLQLQQDLAELDGDQAQDDDQAALVTIELSNGNRVVRLQIRPPW